VCQDIHYQQDSECWSCEILESFTGLLVRELSGGGESDGNHFFVFNPKNKFENGKGNKIICLAFGGLPRYRGNIYRNDLLKPCIVKLDVWFLI